MVISFGCDAEKTAGGLPLFPRATYLTITMAWRAVMLLANARAARYRFARSGKTAVSIDTACGTTARLALEWLNAGAGPIDDSRRLQRKD
jgi:hypothetical protein